MKRKKKKDNRNENACNQESEEKLCKAQTFSTDKCSM